MTDRSATRVLVTGAAGFVGVPVCRTLSAAGYRVTAVTRAPPPAPLDAERTEVMGDLSGHTDWSAVLAGIDVVVHLAGRAHAADGDGEQVEKLYTAANVEVLEGLAEAAVGLGVKRFVFVSSIKVNGEETHGTPFTADQAPSPEDAYGRSKLRAEQRLREIAGNRMQWVILRPPLMYGPGVRGNMARLFGIADRGWPVPFGSIANARDLLYVDSFADLVALAVDAPAADGGTFLARDGTPLSTPRLFRGIAAALGRSARVLPFPVSALRLAGLLTGRAPEVRRLVGDLEIDDGPTRRLLGWTPAVATDEALARTAAWFKARPSRPGTRDPK
ncbi:NAD-dependent epimerase/dehydratase family protein [Hyphomicrobium sp.]|uniref:NAD-dependent epimerase/dehydratase family protein n=1 Tax=Hyphomicrobium sp. TaxID=82 RepID=UPI0025BC8404|nr:NAD-dependent epimerase/dehydratase family protein [Hyphomicrobium sp.]MCC7252670.1 NAD-dependent epimerase/dehydratase family protein [Hyphomicrobium sp.]